MTGKFDISLSIINSKWNIKLIMKQVLSIFVLILIAMNFIYPQGNIVAFYEYDIKDGMNDQFVKGYARDLEWHKSQEDDWAWIGWFILNGDRRGRFVDATPEHNWADFDNWKINASENSRLNKIHWIPYVENMSGSYKKVLNEFSHYERNWFQSKYLQVYIIDINNKNEIFKRFLDNYKELLKNKLKDNSFVWMKTISGGKVSEYYLFVSINKIEELALCENIFDFSSSQNNIADFYNNSVYRNTSELWKYSNALSLIAGEK